MNARPANTTGLGVIVTLLLTAVVLSARGAMSPLNPGFSVLSWDTEDGLPESPIHALARTPDGYLWLGTSAGLVRFDGARFVTLTTKTEPALRDNRVSSLLVDGNGVLWIGTQSGTLARRQNGTFAHVRLDPRLHDVPINSLQPARGGGLWLATRGRGLVRFKDGACDFSTPTNGLRQGDVTSLVLEEPNLLSVVSGQQLMTLDQGRWQIVPGGPDKTTPTYAVAAGKGDAALIATSSENPFRERGGRVFKFAVGQPFRELAPYPWPQDSRLTSICSILEDHEGRVWIGTVGNGVFFWTPGADWQQLASEVVQIGRTVSLMIEDAEGLIWMAGSQGTLYQVRERRVASLRLSVGIAGIRINSVCAARDGNVWVGTDDAGVFRFANDAFTQVTNGLASLHVYSVLMDLRTNLWAGTLNGLYRWQNNRFAQVALPTPSIPVVISLYEDRLGYLWAGTSGGLVRITPEGATTLFGQAAGLDHFYFLSLAEDTQGRLWTAVGDRGLYRLVGARFEKFGSDRWPAAKSIRSLQADADGALWITTTGAGLFRFKDGVFREWSRQEGLPEIALNEIIADDRGNLWFSSANGIFGCPKAALMENRGGRNQPLLFWHLSVEDGMDSKACSGAAQSVSARSANGRLWFPNWRALAVFDPAKVSRPGLTLAPFAEEVVADGVRCQPDGAGVIRLRSDTRRVEFHYTCPDLRSPGRLRFQYRLEGSDADWADAGAQRVAFYGHLPPGDYRFRVMAGSAAGGWREAAEALPLTIVPSWWERTPVRVAGALAGAALLGGTVWLMTRTRLRRKLARLQSQHARETERIRIASDLHDEVGSNLGSIALLSEMVSPPAPELDEIRRLALATAGSLRDIVWILDPSGDSMEDMVLRMNDTARPLLPGIPFEMVVEGEIGSARPSLHLRQNVFPMFKEILHNIAKHARATRVRILVKVSANQFHLCVEDDGVGFDESQVRPGNGLKKLRRRATDLRCKLQIQSQPGHGSRLAITTSIT